MARLFKEIMDKYGKEYMLRQLAEECNELAQASLKLIRVWHKETPMREDEAIEHLLEEIADVTIMLNGVTLDMLDREQRDTVYDIQMQKMDRWHDRMIAGNMEEHIW
jgi:NTP pyrophosphatase (non-canonical NTP hydrolase)